MLPRDGTPTKPPGGGVEAPDVTPPGVVIPELFVPDPLPDPNPEAGGDAASAAGGGGGGEARGGGEGCTVAAGGGDCELTRGGGGDGGDGDGGDGGGGDSGGGGGSELTRDGGGGLGSNPLFSTTFGGCTGELAGLFPAQGWGKVFGKGKGSGLMATHCFNRLLSGSRLLSQGSERQSWQAREGPISSEEFCGKESEGYN